MGLFRKMEIVGQERFKCIVIPKSKVTITDMVMKFVPCVGSKPKTTLCKPKKLKKVEFKCNSNEESFIFSFEFESQQGIQNLVEDAFNSFVSLL